MVTRRRTTRGSSQLGFDAISIEGALLSPDWLARVVSLEAGLQSEADYRVPKGLNLRDEIGRFWRIAQAYWRDARHARGRGADPGAVATAFIDGLLRHALGFESLARVEPITLDERVFPIGRTALGGRVPVVIAPDDHGLDVPSRSLGDSGRKRSPFGLAQEYLNAEDAALWGIVANGTVLRIVRDNASLTRPAWIEADLERMFGEDRFADFTALWLLAHESRFGRPGTPVSDCALETWRRTARDEGTKAREHLRDNVKAALIGLGRGFLAHPDNQALRSALEGGALSTTAYFQQLLRLVYRLIFLLTVEERGLLHAEGADERAKALYAEGYSLRRLRERSARRSAHDRFADLWEATQIVFRGVAMGEPRLGLPALAGIFASTQCPALDGAKLENRALLLGVHSLSWLRERTGIARVNWRDMGPEELGSVYESLLELVPRVSVAQRSFDFEPEGTEGHQRRSTGSYYTPDHLVQKLLDEALEPLVRERLAALPADPAAAILGLKIVDPACGSGHFLLAAARRLALHLARLRAQGTPSGVEYRHALREIVGRCLYGVDLNPLAVELCRVSLWMEAVEPGLPLTFLSSHVRHGNALLGATPKQLSAGVPDAAWEVAEGDDKRVATSLKKRNAHAQGGQRSFDALWSRERSADVDPVTSAVKELEASPDQSVEELSKKDERWQQLLDLASYRHQRMVADAWCAAFLWSRQGGPLSEVAPTNDVWLALRDEQRRLAAAAETEIERIAGERALFHWHLAFAHVFAAGGFDLVLGNPPWIAHAGRAAQPIPGHVKLFCKHVYASFGGYPTTHGMFVERAAQLLAPAGRLALIIPSSLSELPSYEPTRRAHDELCDFDRELTDFGEGQFPGVTQPCMALVSFRRDGGRGADAGTSWPTARPDLSPLGRALLDRLGALEALPRDLFGERGFQSDDATAEHYREQPGPEGRFTRGMRGGSDIQEFVLGAPSFFADPVALGGRLRTEAEYREVKLVVRNTARYPIVAPSDGLAFRNSLLAIFASPAWPAEALLALLNSALIRWAHYHRFRDARQPVMPQLKIAHLRSIPTPPRAGAADELAAQGRSLLALGRPPMPGERAALDRLVFDLYALTPDERALVEGWHTEIHAPRARRGRAAAARGAA